MVAGASVVENVGMRRIMGCSGLLVVSVVTVAVEESTTMSCAGSAGSCRSPGCIVAIIVLTKDCVVGGSRLTGGGSRIRETSVVCTAVADAVMTKCTTIANTVVIADVVIGGGHGYVIAGVVGMSRTISSTTAGESGKETHG